MTIFVGSSSPVPSSSTASQLIQSALERIGAYGTGQTMTAADSARGLDQLNKVLDSLSNESLACFAFTENSLVLTPGKTQYTIGSSSSADINTTRPLRLREGRGAAYTNDSNGNTYPLDVIPQAQWNTIGNRTSQTQSDIPSLLFYDPQFPLGVLNLWPTPTIGYTIYFDSLLQLARMANLTQAFSLPPGYELMIETQLAVQLWPFFKKGELTRTLVNQANNAKRNVKRTNKRSDKASLDAALVTTGGTYDIYTDSYRPG